LFSDVIITTRHASSSIGTKLIFDGEGQVSSRVPCPREVQLLLLCLNLIFSFQVGTTVSIRSLFHRFPVRRTELQSHSKREFSQALNIIQSFTLLSRQIQFFQVSSSPDNHPPTHPLLTLTPSTSLKDTLAQLFGQKILETIIHIDDDVEDKQFKVNKIIFEKFFIRYLVRWLYISTSTWFWSFIN
jgi:DNA mismatch repair ATPase MutL